MYSTGQHFADPRGGGFAAGYSTNTDGFGMSAAMRPRRFGAASRRSLGPSSDVEIKSILKLNQKIKQHLQLPRLAEG